VPPRITELIDKQDTRELVRDAIAAILKVEEANQRLLAEADAQDPREWALSVFVEREAPWEQFQNPPKDDLDQPPVVSVSFESETTDASASSVVDVQKSTGIFNVDVYGYGAALDVEGGGHQPGDMRAALAAQRGVRLVRNILMAGQYTYLAMNGVVTRRWVDNITAFVPELDAKPLQQVVACRLSFAVDYYDATPQVIPDELEILFIEVKRAENGEVLLAMQFGEEDDDS
jgi:hypothetical protein